MLGRKVRRGLLLLERGKTDHDELLLNARDRKVKLMGKSLEDSRRGAWFNLVFLSNLVIRWLCNVSRKGKVKPDLKQIATQ